MSGAKVWVEQVVIPTYEIGEAEKNPIFLDKRVYQGSTGKVYPYPTVEKISDEKTDKEYEAVCLENEYLKVMVLPSLGGRIQRAYDKTNDYDFDQARLSRSDGTVDLRRHRVQLAAAPQTDYISSGGLCDERKS